MLGGKGPGPTVLSGASQPFSWLQHPARWGSCVLCSPSVVPQGSVTARMRKTGDVVANELPAAFCSGRHPRAQTGGVACFFSAGTASRRLTARVAPCPCFALLGFGGVDTLQSVFLWERGRGGRQRRGRQGSAVVWSSKKASKRLGTSLSNDCFPTHCKARKGWELPKYY